MSNSQYWINKEIRANKAMDHTREMERQFKNEIKFSSDNSILYSDLPLKEKLMVGKYRIFVENMDSVSAIMKYSNPNNKMAVLNFASFKHPGGMFLKGSSAQEESLCMESTLFNVLNRQTQYYFINKKHYLNRALYADRAIYSPDIIFQRDGYNECKCDVITCAAPNKGAAMMKGVSAEENYIALSSRIRLILNICDYQFVDTIILGAFGCGVFKQDPYEVATIFKNEIQYIWPYASTIVFAIPGGKNLEVFREVFKRDDMRNWQNRIQYCKNSNKY